MELSIVVVDWKRGRGRGVMELKDGYRARERGRELERPRVNWPFYSRLQKIPVQSFYLDG